MAELKTNINDTYFAWSGDVSSTSGAYFRITGPTLLIEFAPQSLGCSTGGGVGAPGGTGGGAPSGGANNGQAATEATATTYENTFSLDLGSFSDISTQGGLCHVHTIYRDPTNAYGSAVTG